MIFPHQKRLLEPKLPKYVPFTRINGIIALKFNIPVFSPSPTTQSTVSTTQPVFSLQASSSCCPFASLSFNRSLLLTPSPTPEQDFPHPSVDGAMAAAAHRHADIMFDMSVNILLHGGVDQFVGMDMGVLIGQNYRVLIS
jgi:hypothetical protein